MPWLDRAVGLSPNFAQGYYAHGWADVVAGRGDEALDQLGKAMDLSPLDPFLYAMQSATGLAYLRLENLEKAAYWAEKGARAPGAHFLIGAIAAMIFEIKGDRAKAAYWGNLVLDRKPDASVATFFNAFPFEDPELRQVIARALVSIGLAAG